MTPLSAALPRAEAEAVGLTGERAFMLSVTTDQTLEDATALLEQNTQTASLNGRTFRFTVPSSRSYPFHWLWDSCFHAIVWAKTDVERAADELRGLLAWQQADGRIPHVVFWDRSRVKRLNFHYLESTGGALAWLRGRKPWTSALTQPPVIAQAVERIVDAGHPTFLEEALPALERYYRYLAGERDPDGDGLISTLAVFETGLDYSAAYDKALRVNPSSPLSLFLRSRTVQLACKRRDYRLERIFAETDGHAEDPLVNAVYCDALLSLSRLAGMAGRTELAAWALRQADRTEAALLERSWDERLGLFCPLVGRGEERINRVRTVQGLIGLLLPQLPSERLDRLISQLEDPRRFGAPYPIPSVALDEPTFVRDSHVRGFRFIWRGPSSINTNWLIVRGLRRHGLTKQAAHLAERSRALVERAGFNEFYDPINGRGVGAEDFGWATLASDL